MASIQPGETVAGYHIESLLGRGGMASVYLAEDHRLKRKVALKILAPELAADEVFRRRFVDESERLASVDHPNIIPVYEAGQDGEHLFIAMRYVESTDLKRLIADAGRLEPQRAVSLVTQVAGALDAAHAKGLVHRDVKPANVLVAAGSGGEHAYLSDFGLTKRSEETSGLTKTGHFMGTIDYVAPEQIVGTGVDARTDQYALACVLFECLTGHPPYRKDDDAAVLFSHLSEPQPRPSDERTGVPPALDDVVARGMAKEKQDRYPDSMTFARAARDALSTTPPAVAALAPGVVPAPTAGKSRRRVAAAVGGIVVVLALIAGFLMLTGDGDDGPEQAAPGASGTQTDGQGPVTVLALDGTTGDPVTTLQDEAFTEHLFGILSVQDGSLWQATEHSLVRRDPTTGEILDTIPIASGWHALDGGFGYVWAARPKPGDTIATTELDRIDPLSGNTRTFELEGRLADMRTGNGSVWFLTTDGTLSEIDPINGKVVNTFDTGAESPGVVVPVVGVDATSPDGERVWLLDPELNTLTPIDPQTGEVGASLGVGGARITDAKVVGDDLWVSSQTEVTAIDLLTLDETIFEIPEGISAGSVAPLPDGSLVWVANCGCPIQE